MLFLGEYLFQWMFHSFEAFLPIIIIALIISLIVRHSKGKQTPYGYVKPGEVLMEGTDQKVQIASPNNAAPMNILLYIGSFLIVGSILLFIKDEPSLVPFVTIFITIITYVAGILLYRFVEYLRPVATAFTYTAMVLFPLWYYVFNELGVSNEIALFTSTTISFFAYAIAAFSIDSRVAGWLSYIWLLSLGWTGASMIDATAGSHSFTMYAFFLWPLIVSLFPTICWAYRVKWLPVAYRQATKFFAQWLTPVFAFFTLSAIATPNISTLYPALRIIASSLAVVNGLIAWLANKNDRLSLAALRLYIQLLILMIVADATNYSLYILDLKSSVAVAAVWGLGFLAQAVCSLFMPQKREREKQIEKGVLILSLLGIFSTWIFCLKFDLAALIAVAAPIAVLGVLIGWRYKNIAWANATVLAIMFITLITFFRLVPNVGGQGWLWSLFFTFVILTLALLLLYTPFRKIQPKRSLGVAITTAASGSVVCILTAAFTDFNMAGWLASAGFMAAVSMISRQYSLLEASAYLAAFSLSALISSVFDKPSYYGNNDAELIRMAIQCHIIALPLLIFGWIKERKTTNGARKILGYLALNVPLFIIVMESVSSNNIILSMIYIFESTGFIIYGAFTHHKWMTITSSVLLAFTALSLTGGFNGLWLMLAGIGLITFVIYQLVKGNKKL